MRNFFRTLAPELFDAKVAIHTDGSYSFSYDGILIFVPALIQAGRGVIDARTEAQLKEAAGQLRQEGFRKADYLAGGLSLSEIRSEHICDGARRESALKKLRRRA